MTLIQVQERYELMDTKFAVALHILTMISEETSKLSSQTLANSVGTNASYIRKILALLKNSGIITSHQGKTGYQLTRLPEQISLLTIYLAIQESDHIHLFAVHQNANPKCPVGKYIESAMRPLFADIEVQLAEALRRQTLKDVIDNLYYISQQKKTQDEKKSI